MFEMRQKLLSYRAIKRPRYVSPKDWRVLEERGYLKTLQKLGKEEKVNLTVKDMKNLEEMLEGRKKLKTEKEEQEDKSIMKMCKYLLTLREMYYKDKVGIQKIEDLGKTNKGAVLRDFKKLNWQRRVVHVDHVGNAIKILEAEGNGINSETIKDLWRTDYKDHNFPVPAKASMPHIKKTLLKQCKDGKLKE
jgi:5'-3' exonuclease